VLKKIEPHLNPETRAHPRTHAEEKAVSRLFWLMTDSDIFAAREGRRLGDCWHKPFVLKVRIHRASFRLRSVVISAD